MIAGTTNSLQVSNITEKQQITQKCKKLPSLWHVWYDTAGIIMGIGSANERQRYNVTLSLIGSARIQNDPCTGLGIWGNKKGH